jgi:hypothetical protein
LLKPNLKSNSSVSRASSNFYAEWRQRRGVIPCLHDDDSLPPERLLQAIWFHQRLRRDQLLTLDGRRVLVLHPGFWNRESGPDFRGAVIQLADDPPRVCDVEVDLHSGGWTAHRHAANPAFARVGLHVVWEGDARHPLPTLALGSCLDAPLGELALWLNGETGPGFPEALRGLCRPPLGELAPPRLRELLHQAALVRLQSKAVQIQARARQAGWEQALWEGLFRALGYKQNHWPMQRLGELRGRICPAGAGRHVLTAQSRLLGVGGLLPSELPRGRAAAHAYVRGLWDFWWRDREQFADCLLPRAVWRLSGLRPANHPQRRLALAAHWLAADDLAARFETWCVASLREADWVPALLEQLQVVADDFWSLHWTLTSARMPKPQPLLGTGRVTDLALNAVVPWLWMRAREGRNRKLQDELERRYFGWPAAEDNALLRLGRERLLGGRAPRDLFQGAAAQQGLLQVMRDFCEASDPLCQGCQFPGLVRGWSRDAG